MANMVNPTKVVTGKKTRWSYANVWEPKATQDGYTYFYYAKEIVPDGYTVTYVDNGASGGNRTIGIINTGDSIPSKIKLHDSRKNTRT